MKTKVLHLAWDGGLGGVQRYLLKVVGSSHWRESEHAICFFTEEGEVINDTMLKSIKQFSLGMKHGYDFHLNHRLREIVDSIDPEVIHCHCDTPVFLPELLRRTGRRFIFHEHGDTIMRRKRSWVTSALWNVIGRRWSTVIANSAFVRQDFIHRYPFMDHRCQVLHNPLLEQCTVEVEQADHPVIGVFARMEWQKGVDRILEMMPALLKQIPELELRYYGHGSMLEELKQRAHELNCRDAVTFAGYVDDPLVKMSEVDLVVVPSRIEPFGLVAVEAQSVGTPVVAFDQTGVVEIVEDQHTGRIVPQDAPQQMIQAIIEMLSDPIYLAGFCECARHHALMNFSLKQHCQSLEQIYSAA